MKTFISNPKNALKTKKPGGSGGAVSQMRGPGMNLGLKKTPLRQVCQAGGSRFRPSRQAHQGLQGAHRFLLARIVGWWESQGLTLTP